MRFSRSSRCYLPSGRGTGLDAADRVERQSPPSIVPGTHNAFTHWMPRLTSFIAAIVVLLSLSSPTHGQAIDKAVLDRAKDATVYIKVKISGQLRSTGSGFVMRNSGGTLMVMTNRHVAVPSEDDLPDGVKPELFAVFRSGTPQQQELPAKLLAYDTRRVRDLAVIEVKGVNQPPQPILADVTASEADFYETMPAFALGFPRNSFNKFMVGDVNVNPAVTVNAMTISSLRRDETNKMARVQFAGSLIEGNSGGPVVDPKGRLVGVVVERNVGDFGGFAIPPSVVAAFLAGDIGEIVYAELLNSSGPDSQLKLQARLVDPLNRLRKVFIRYARQSGPIDAIKPNAEGSYSPIAGGTSVALMVTDGIASGTFAMPINKPEDRNIAMQWVATDSVGTTRTSKPFPATLPDRPGRINDLDQESRPKVLAKWSCETNLGDGIKMTHTPGSTKIDLPAGVPLNNAPQYNLFNAPCALVKIEGDFIVAVEVENTFDPGGEGVVIPSGKKLPFSFQSAGLLLWQDEKNFVRFERNKRSNGPITMTNQVLVEVYKGGRSVAVHYLDIPEQPVGLAFRRKGASIQLLFALPPNQLRIFYEMAVDFNNEILVGVAAANLSKRPFHAQLDNFSLKALDGRPVEPKPFKLAKLVDSGAVRLPDGTRIFEGAGLKVKSPDNAPVAPQTNMADYKGEWSDNRQLLWSNDKAGQALTLEIPVDTDGKYEIKAKFTLAPDYAIAKLDIDGRPLYKGDKIDFYSKDVRPTSLMSLGTYSLNKGTRKLTITVFSKNAKSSGYRVGLDEVRLVPTK